MKEKLTKTEKVLKCIVYSIAGVWVSVLVVIISILIYSALIQTINLVKI